MIWSICSTNHGGVLEIGLRVALLGVDEQREVARIAKEEDGRIVEDPIPES